MPPRKRKATLQEDPPAKRPSRGRAAKKQDDPVWATQNPKSDLVAQDLHAKYCDPATYQNWTREDWEEIHDCLPENVPFNDDGYSVPMTFFKYDPDWRRLVREFQEDLGAGRYEPEWLKQATLAMEERAAGKFDKHKEDQFEAFWGQKQTLHHEARAGESAKIKLSQLVEAGLIKVEDTLSYRRTFRSKSESLMMIEKDLRVISINGTTLTVAIPPGQFRYPRFQAQLEGPTTLSTEDDAAGKRTNPEDEAIKRTDGKIVVNGGPFTHGEGTAETEASNDGMKFPPRGSDPHTSVDSNLPSKASSPVILVSNGNTTSRDDLKKDDTRYFAKCVAVNINMTKKMDNNGTERVAETSKAASNLESGDREDIAHMSEPISTVDESEEAKLNENIAIDECAGVGDDQASVHKRQAPGVDPESGCVLYDVWKPNGLENKIIEVDGRMDPKDAPIASSWRFIRVERNNQDLGSLFDIREEFYVWKSPTIVKMPKKDREKNTALPDHESLKGQTKEQTTKAKPSAQERPLERAPCSSRKSKRPRHAKKAQLVNSDDDNIVEDCDKDESIDETESDDNFDTKNSTNEKKVQTLKSPGRSKRSSGQVRKQSTGTHGLRKGANQKADRKYQVEQDGEPGKNDIVGLEIKPNRTHLCPNCGRCFTRASSVRTHIQRVCKKVPRG